MIYKLRVHDNDVECAICGLPVANLDMTWPEIAAKLERHQHGRKEVAA